MCIFLCLIAFPYQSILMIYRFQVEIFLKLAPIVLKIICQLFFMRVASYFPDLSSLKSVHINLEVSFYRNRLHFLVYCKRGEIISEKLLRGACFIEIFQVISEDWNGPKLSWNHKILSIFWKSTVSRIQRKVRVKQVKAS